MATLSRYRLPTIAREPKAASNAEVPKYVNAAGESTGMMLIVHTTIKLCHKFLGAHGIYQICKPTFGINLANLKTTIVNRTTIGSHPIIELGINFGSSEYVGNAMYVHGTTWDAIKTSIVA